MLNNMAGSDFLESLDRQAEWGITCVDLKDAVFGHNIVDLTDEECLRATQAIAERGMRTYCLSSTLLGGTIDTGEVAFRDANGTRVARLAEIAKAFQPTMVRLLAAQTARRAELDNAVRYVEQAQPWLIDFYNWAIEALRAAGFQVTIENEIGGSLFAKPEEVHALFKHFPRRNVCFTWDIQNMWQMGTFPSMAVYRELQPLIGYVHLKGGRTDGGDRLVWKAPLDEASWPVKEIVTAVIADGVSPVICLNSSHGKMPDGYDCEEEVRRDVTFMRELLVEAEQ